MQNSYQKSEYFLRDQASVTCLFIYLFNQEGSEDSFCEDQGKV